MSQVPALAEQRQAQIVRIFDNNLPKIREVAPKTVDMDKFSRLTRSYLYQNPDLLNCDQQSLMSALFECATLGLYPSAVLKEAYLVPFKGKVKLIPHWHGLTKLAKGGELRAIRPYLVYKQDQFEIEYGYEEKLIHKPDFEHDFLDEDIIGCYVVKEYLSGDKSFFYMPIKKVLRIRNQYSPDWKARGAESTWAKSFPGMVIKTVVKRALDNEELSEPVAALIHRDDAIERGQDPLDEPPQLPVDYLTGKKELPESSLPSDVEATVLDAEIPADYKPETQKPEPPKPAAPKKSHKAQPKPEPPAARPVYEATDDDCPI